MRDPLLWTVIIAVSIGIAVGVAIGWQLHSAPIVAYGNGARAYKVIRGGQPATGMRADKITLQDACVLFWRQDRIDTVLCPGMGGELVVTEIYE